VEFGLVLPILLLILFAIIEYGWFFTNQIVLTNAVSAGARAGIKAREWDAESPEDPREQAIAAVKQAFWPRSLQDSAIEVDLDYTGGDTPRCIEVKVSGLPYTSITGYVPATLIPDHLAARAVMAFP
jgi:hypothetical protein